MATNMPIIPFSNSILLLFLFLYLIFLSAGTGKSEELRLNYYSETCPDAEDIVREQVTKLRHSARDLTNSLLRNFFHDCMVESCDASLLLATTGDGVVSELESTRSIGTRYFSKIYKIKEALETQCPSIVSCADIITLSAREAVAMMGGPYIPVRTGRRDGMESQFAVVDQYLPDHNDSMPTVLSRFQSIGIDPEGVVGLLGAHSVGRVHCQNLVHRLYPSVDPTLDSDFADYLKRRCPGEVPDPAKVGYARNDLDTPDVLDNNYYNNVLKGRGLLVVDQELGSDPDTAPYAHKMAADNSYFLAQFARAFLLLSENNPLTGEQGEIRQDCRYVNGRRD